LRDSKGIIASPLEDNIMSWQAVIFGPEDTPWEGGFINGNLY